MKVITDEKRIDEVLSRGVEHIFPTKEALKKEMSAGRRLRVYLGVDPTAPHLHFGHAEQLLTLKRFFALGHEVILLIGDFTARIGDPTDKSAARVPLTPQEVKDNLATFKRQAKKILPIGRIGGAKIKYNSAWLGRMNFTDVLRLAQHFTVQQMIERDMFQERLRAQKPIGLHEFLYPLMQGYDSVAMNVDVEVGGNDQTFNMLAGRTLQKIYNNKEKFVIANRLLVDPETNKKIMSKSEGNTINLDDAPSDIFGKVIALDDAGMFVLAELSTEMPSETINELREKVSAGTMNPRDAKLLIAAAAVELIYGGVAGNKERENFEKLFSKKEIPDDVPIISAPHGTTVIHMTHGTAALRGNPNESNSEARRLIEQGAVEVGGAKKTNPNEILNLDGGEVVKIGKHHFFRITLR